LFGVLATRIRQFTRDDWRPLEVGFRHAAPANLTLHHQVFGDVVRFGQLTDSMRVDRSQLAWPLRMSDKRLLAVLERYAEEALRRAPPPGEYAARVKHALIDLLAEGDCSAATVARRLEINQRLLQRYLAEEGTSVRELVDQMRRELAEEYLTDTR